jgi:hypothetical protein
MEKFHFVSQRELAAGRTSATEDDEAIGKKRRRAVIEELMQFHGLNPPDEVSVGG